MSARKNRKSKNGTTRAQVGQSTRSEEKEIYQQRIEGGIGTGFSSKVRRVSITGRRKLLRGVKKETAPPVFCEHKRDQRERKINTKRAA